MLYALLKFTEEVHVVIKDGYIRVTEIFSQWDRFSHIDPVVLENKANIGTEVHRAIDAHEECIHLPLEKGHGYFDSFVKWSNLVGVQSQLRSIRFYCEMLKITGEIDLIAKFPGSDQLILIDFKTCAQKDDKFWKLQGQFYHYLCKQNGIEVSDRFLFLKLDKNGEFPKVYEYHSSPSLLNVCMSSYICYKYLNSVA